MKHTVYDTSSGEILGWVDCDDSDLQANIDNLAAGEGLLQDVPYQDPDEYYYNLVDSVVARPEITATANKTSISADNTDEFLLTGLPTTCTVTVDDTDYVVTDGEFGFATDLAGMYTVSVKQFPYIAKSWEVTAT